MYLTILYYNEIKKKVLIMSIELIEVKKKIDIFEKTINNPELLLSEEIVTDIDSYNLLINITLNGKDYFDYLIDYLSKINVFADTKIRLDINKIIISIPSLDKYKKNDVIMSINLEKHTYKIINKCIDDYKAIMSKDYVLMQKELPDFFKKYENYTLKQRFLTAYRNLMNKNKTKIVRIQDCLFNLFVSKKYIQQCLNKEYKKIDEINKANKKIYDKNIELQKFYLQKAQNHINKIEQKQIEIIKYLSRYRFINEKY